MRGFAIGVVLTAMVFMAVGAFAWNEGDIVSWSSVTHQGYDPLTEPGIVDGDSFILDRDDHPGQIPEQDAGTIVVHPGYITYTPGEDSWLYGVTGADGNWELEPDNVPMVSGDLFRWYEKVINGYTYRMIIFPDGDYQIWQNWGDDNWKCVEMGNWR